jgi:restriction system protein
MHTPALLTPAEFEEHIRDWLSVAGAGLSDLQVTRLETIEGDGGAYEMDVVARFTAFQGAEFVVLVECKHHRNPIKREVIQVLEAKLRDAKAHKGIVAATSSFQSGALEYAKEHGIATLLVSDSSIGYMTRSMGSGRPPPTPGHAIAWLCSPAGTGYEMARIDGDQSRNMRDWLKN